MERRCKPCAARWLRRQAGVAQDQIGARRTIRIAVSGHDVPHFVS